MAYVNTEGMLNAFNCTMRHQDDHKEVILYIGSLSLKGAVREATLPTTKDQKSCMYNDLYVMSRFVRLHDTRRTITISLIRHPSLFNRLYICWQWHHLPGW